MTDYEWAEGPEEIVREVIATVDEHADLSHATILCVFRDRAARSRGRVVLGRARQIGGLNKFLVEAGATEVPLFVLEFGRDVWDTLSVEQRRALVDHELCHLTMTPDEDIPGRWVGRTRGHDLEEFLGVVDRHGLWKADVAALATAAAGKLEQLTFELVGGSPDDTSQ